MVEYVKYVERVKKKWDLVWVYLKLH